MRVSVDISGYDLCWLDLLSKDGKLFREDLIQQAVENYLAPHRKTPLDQAFGLWAHQQEDGLAYQDVCEANGERD